MPDTLLLKPEQLHVLLERIEERNTVIHKLSQENERDANTTARQILAFWLGNSVLLSRLLVTHGNQSELIRGYLCLLELDKKIGLLKQSDAQQKTINDLRHCQLELLLYFNSNHSLFNDSPDVFFAEFKRIVQLIDPHSTSALSEKNLLIETQKECLAILNNDAIHHHMDLQTRTKPGLSSLITRQPNVSEYMVRRISTNYNLRIFANDQTSLQYSFGVQLIPGKGGIILEGLLVENKRQVSDTVVLAQIARSSFQSAYLQNHAAEFCAFFKTNVFFLNHRNYSTRAERNAQSIYELAQDVFDTAVHFHQLNQKVVLYGMCGGAPHTLLAAYLLKRNNIPFKLIIDRFATDYGAFSSSGTLNRKMALTYIHNPELFFVPIKDRMQIQGYLLLSIIYGLLIYLLLELTRTNINAAQIIHQLPAEDVLLLQARPPKKVLEFADYAIHPAYEARGVIKGRRYGVKRIFKKLIEECSQMNTLLADHDPLQKIFRKFSLCFDFYLQLINDEKLTCREPEPTTRDLHGVHLYQLATRSHLPLQSFVRGFFAPPAKNSMEQLNQLHSFSVDDTLDALKTIYQDDHLDLFAHHFSHFLNELVQHKTVIAQFANRALTTNQTDITKPVQELLESALYTELSLINKVMVRS